MTLYNTFIITDIDINNLNNDLQTDYNLKLDGVFYDLWFFNTLTKGVVYNEQVLTLSEKINFTLDGSVGFSLIDGTFPKIYVRA